MHNRKNYKISMHEMQGRIHPTRKHFVLSTVKMRHRLLKRIGSSQQKQAEENDGCDIERHK
jgi:hypothetical protein